MEGEQVLRHWDLLRVVAASVCRRHTVERTDPPWIDIFQWRARLRLRTGRLDDLLQAHQLCDLSTPDLGADDWFEQPPPYAEAQCPFLRDPGAATFHMG